MKYEKKNEKRPRRNGIKGTLKSGSTEWKISIINPYYDSFMKMK